ncbi:MAG: CRISPR-associated endonuclease Cas3'' [candidate division WOR-3 bacterium]
MSEKIELLSAPSETLVQHLDRVLGKWDKIKSRFSYTLPRLFGTPWEEIEEAINRMFLLHDLGKATEKWQKFITAQKEERDNETERKSGAPHAQLGGAYLWWASDPKDDLVMASAFAIAIHHTDSALARPGLEDPATMLVTSWLVNEDDDTIRWHNGLDGFMGWLRDEHGLDLPHPRDMGLYDVSEFALELRKWARGAEILELHRRRLQVAALHSVIKVCDIRAAIARSEEPVTPANTFTWTIVNGGMIP